MLFLVNAIPKAGAGGPPTKEFVALVVKEWETVLKYIKDGKIEKSYGYENRPGGFSIWSVNSEPELKDLLKTLPLHPYLDFEITGLKTAETSLNSSKIWLNSIN